ncbi:MAG: hypothetical protein GY703_07170 [Gammaproteobacteria bacterium]|nr:hypothetical protein [Gammaproteobacteria bacterium]
MFTTARTIILSILIVVVLIASWSKLRLIEDGVDHQPQRWRMDDHPTFRKNQSGVIEKATGKE